ncbi:MAG: hypothetical protein MUF58_01440 [Arcicella sp.]|jgi:hypothetical protein|nr:hypothetical protein [Arcicella sp.]
MKNTIIKILLLLLIQRITNAQNINWRAFSQDQKHLIGVNTGLDYGLSYGVNYGRKLNTKLSMVLNGEFSLPSGNKVLEDFKVKMGVQLELIHSGNFSATVKVNGIFRRFENDYARLLNFGSEFATVAGYYKPRWYIAGEISFDKAIVTHIKHLSAALDNNPDLTTGWYIPTGGNFAYGIQSGMALGQKNDLNLKIGKLLNQNFKTEPTLPFYFQIGYNRRF